MSDDEDKKTFNTAVEYALTKIYKAVDDWIANDIQESVRK